MNGAAQHVVWFEALGREDVSRVGGKNASLGEMVRNLGQQGVRVPPGFATTADAYSEFISASDIDSISVSPDSFVAVKQRVSAAEGALKQAGIQEQ